MIVFTRLRCGATLAMKHAARAAAAEAAAALVRETELREQLAAAGEARIAAMEAVAAVTAAAARQTSQSLALPTPSTPPSPDADPLVGPAAQAAVGQMVAATPTIEDRVSATLTSLLETAAVRG